jgi:hypothetical protein
LLHAGEIGIAALRESAQQIERRRRLADRPRSGGADRACARLGELDVVDDVAAIGRQLLPSRFSVGDGARLGELPAMRPTFTTGEAAA